MVEDARSWLDAIYLVECKRNWNLTQIETHVAEVSTITGREPALIVIDDCQRLGDLNQPMETRLPLVVEQVQQAATKLRAPLIATWPDSDANSEGLPHRWNERIPGADVVLTMEKDLERTQKLTEPNQAIVLHIVKNRGGEKGKLAFDFFPSFSQFKEVQLHRLPLIAKNSCGFILRYQRGLVAAVGK